MQLNRSLGCALEMRFNYSTLCENSLEFESHKQQEKILKDFCISSIPFSEIDCKSSSTSSAALLAVVWAFNTSGLLLNFIFLIFTVHFRKNRIVKMSSPNLNVVTLLGSGLTYGSAYLFGIEKQNSFTRPSMEMLIQVRICTLCIGGSLTFGPIIGKSWRLYKVFTQQVPDKRVVIKDFQLLVMLSLLVLTDIILLLIWIFLDPVQCLQNLNADLKVTENGLSCTLRQGYFCTSLYSEFWLILFLGFKGILLMYGTYLAGLTHDLSCPPVNQSLTLIVAAAIIFLFVGIMLVINSFFYLWHNLVFGLTSGGIFVCNLSINCLIFVPQIGQWKALEKQNANISNMAKYFTGSNKNFHSTMYSDEEIYQLLGEKNTMMQQLAEKETAIANLQEQMNNIKDKLKRMVMIKDNCNVADSTFFCNSHLLQSHSTANFSSMVAENLPFSLSQELKPWQNSWLSNLQYTTGSPIKKTCIDDLECSYQQNISSDITTKCRVVNGYSKADGYSSAKHEDQWSSQSTTFTKGKLPEQSLCTLSGETKKPYTSAVSQKQNSEITYVSSEKNQEIFQELSMNHMTVTQASSRIPKDSADCKRSMMWQPMKIQKKIPFHPCGSLASNIQCSVNKSASKMQRASSKVIEYPYTAVRNTEDGDSLSQPPSLPLLVLKKVQQCKPDNGFDQLSSKDYGCLLDDHLRENCASTFYSRSPRNFHYQQKDFLNGIVPGLFPFQYLYLDSSSSSSGEVTYCQHRQACEVCHSSLSSCDSYLVDTFSEYGITSDYGKVQPIVYFNEDLEPTYV